MWGTHRKLPGDERRVGSICGIHLGAAWRKEWIEEAKREVVCDRQDILVGHDGC